MVCFCRFTFLFFFRYFAAGENNYIMLLLTLIHVAGSNTIPIILLKCTSRKGGKSYKIHDYMMILHTYSLDFRVYLAILQNTPPTKVLLHVCSRVVF